MKRLLTIGCALLTVVIALAGEIACPDCGYKIESTDGAACPYCGAWFPPKSEAKTREFRDRIQEIVSFLCRSERIDFFLTRESNRSRQPDHTITGNAEVTTFLADVVLEPKGPCQCAHSRSMVFTSGTKTLTVSFCGHCFDVIDTGNVLQKTDRVMLLRMPTNLWNRIEGIAKEESEQEH